MSKIGERCCNLRSVDLSYCSMLQSGVACQCLLSLPLTLQDLSLCGILISDEALFVNAICRLRTLRQVRFCGVPALNDTTMEKILLTVGDQLEEIDLSGSIMSSLTDAGLQSISTHCFHLQILGMTRLQHTTGATLMPILENIERATLIKTLYLSCTHLVESVVLAVATHCLNIETLDMCSLEFVDDDLLVALSRNCHSLNNVNFRGCSRVTDYGVCTLARYCSLTSVNLSGVTCITDKSVFALANSCPYLQELHINGCTQISKVAVTYLVDCCVPRVNYTHRVPNLAPHLLMARNLDTGEFCRADLMQVDAS